METQLPNDFDSEILDNEDMKNTDIKITPDFYIHNAILKAQQALLNPNLKEGIAQYRFFIEHIEKLCKSADYINKDYEDKLNAYYEDEEYKKEQEQFKKSYLIANKKLELILSFVFNQKPLKSNLKL